MKKQKENSGKGGSEAEGSEYVFELYVAGASPNSARAIANLREICEGHLKGRYRVEIIDVYQDMERAKREALVALPLLVKRIPLPVRKFIGDLSDRVKV